jgi:SAM-dependent methyltransferase
MIAKVILPWFGGSASVWITCMLFFQLLLLGGYVYAHWSISSLDPAKQRITHIVFLAVSMLLLPVAPNPVWKTLANADPILHILGILVTSVGLPFFLLSATSPLLQSWYSRTQKEALPYRYFALSNLASLLGLLMYPVLIEPNLTLPQQSISWSAAYVIFAAMCILSMLYRARPQSIEIPPLTASAGHSGDGDPPPTAREQIVWVLLAACASILLLSVTNYLTQDVASIPFLWVLPLSLYLFSFILCFDREGWYRRSWYVWIIFAALAGMSIVLVGSAESMGLMIVFPVFCAGLFACCMFCHGELASRKPAPRHLTAFYLMISLGGALGGVFVGIAAPLFFNGYYELPIGMITCALLLYFMNPRKEWVTNMICSVLIIYVLFASGIYARNYFIGTRLAVRSFYGNLRVYEYNRSTQNEYRKLVNGTIVHGAQFMDAKRRREAGTYYSPRSGVGLAIKYLQPGPRRVGIIGLGAGTIAGYARPGDTYRFYEIDPQVKEIALREFFYVPECLGKVEIMIGDGRLLLEREADQRYDLLVVDAFNGGSIPVHLLTLEALKLYFRHLKPDGVLALNITNRYLDLAPVVEKLRSTLGKYAILISSLGNIGKEIYCDDWVLMTSDRGLLDIPEIKKIAFKLGTKKDLRVWTDKYSNLFQILRFSE